MYLQVSLRSYEKSRRVAKWEAELPARAGTYRLELGGLCAVRVNLCEDGSCLTGEAEFSFLRPTALAGAVAVELCAADWDREKYVFAPGAVYAGNRFSCQKLPYAPYAQIKAEEALTHPPVVTDIPRLSDTEPVSKIELRSGDMTTPAIGYFSPKDRQGVLLMTTHLANGDYTGLSVYENLPEKQALFALSCPAVREETKYFFGERADGTGFFPHSDAESDDTGRWFEAGEAICLPFVLDFFDAADLRAFFAHFEAVRGTLEQGEPDISVPYGIAYETVKEKFQRENFIEEQGGGYYSVGVRRDVPQQCWQAGWVGGGINGYPFLLEDSGLARMRALETVRFIFDHLQEKTGWVCGMYAGGVYYGDTFDLEHPNHVLLIRKDADLLYFLAKQFLACPTELAPYAKNLRMLADAFVRLWQRYGQIGQFIDTATEEIVIGNSASGAIAPAGLALCYRLFGNAAYLETAEALGALYEREYLDRGIVNGGPGEICQAPDSESAFGLLESYTQLYETTGDARWLTAARAACDLALTWVMNYNFEFPQETPAAKRGIHTTGTVFANAQNKHSAPGICTLSGNSLLKLYRFTGEEAYLEALRNITRGLMQCVSLRERPIYCLEKRYLPVGYVNERCQTSDWEGKETIGGFLCGSNWPEVCVLLTYAEVPGVYVDTAAHRAFALDAVDCGWEGDLLWVENPTAYETTVTILTDDPGDVGAVTCNYFAAMQQVRLKPGQRWETRLETGNTQ